MFWQMILLCPNCEKETVLTKCFYSASGELSFQAYCDSCQHSLSWTTTSEAMKYMASEADKKAGKVEEKPSQKPILQKKELPYLQERLSQEDILQMKKWNIKP